MYLEAINFKNEFLKGVLDIDFYTAFVKSVHEFSREIFLDPTLCENPCFALPILVREHFN
jgi:hypothetical protein